MNVPRLWFVAVLVALVVVLPAIGGEGGNGGPLGSSSSRGAVEPPAAGVQPAPLKGVIRLGPGAVRGTGGRKLLPAVALDQLKQKFTDFSGNATKYETGAKAMPEIAKLCSSKSYSVQDQLAAGCTADETLKQCMDKLYKHCVETYSNPGLDLPTGGLNPITGGSGGGHVPGFSTKEFQESAQAAAAQARALSQLLARYASQVEANAKALVP